MKFFHLSDLHLGKSLNKYSMIEDQKYILNQILTLIDQHRPQAVVIAGDVFDKPVPPVQAVELFDEFLYQLSRQQTAVLVISGNHDSPQRIAYGGRLMAASGIHLSPSYTGQVQPVTLTDCHGEVNFWLLPFVRPAQLRALYPGEEIETFSQAVEKAIGEMKADYQSRNVLVAHQFVTGAALCQSEELYLGGIESLEASLFDGFDYVALGHIHGPQNVGEERIRYCGTPLKYSASEAGQQKSVTVVELEEKGTLRISTLPLTPLREVRLVRGSFAQLTAPDQASEDYCYITLTDEQEIPDGLGQLRQVYPNLLAMEYDNTRTRTQGSVGEVQGIETKQPLELFGELFQSQNGRPMSREQEDFMRELMDSVWEAE